MINKIFLKLFGVFDVLKDFFFRWGVKILIVIAIICILHNICKFSEISSNYQGEYKNLVCVYDEGEKYMNVYSEGVDGGYTVVIMPEFGAPSPIIQYKTLIDGLKDSNKVVVVEPFGYGYSFSMKEYARSNENIVKELITALERSNIPGPYVLVASDISNCYAMYMQQNYPELVSSIIAINGVYPQELNDEYRLKNIKSRVSNVKITSIWELTGYERLACYIAPHMFYIDNMSELKDVYGSEEFKLYRNRIGSQYLSRTMVREIDKLESNLTEMLDYKYPDTLSTLQILSSEKESLYNIEKVSKETEYDLDDYAKQLITNESIQQVITIQGDAQMLQLSNPDALIRAIRTYLGENPDYEFVNTLEETEEEGLDINMENVTDSVTKEINKVQDKVENTIKVQSGRKGGTASE